MSISLTDFIKATGNEFASIVDDGIVAGDVLTYHDTGSYALNALLSGSIYLGLPGNKITGIGADSSTGKTYFLLETIKYFLKTNPTGICIIFESESALTRKMLIERGIDVKRVGIVPVATVQEFKNQCIKVVSNYEKVPKKERQPLFLALDSLGMLSTAKEMADSEEGKDTKDMTRAALIKAAFRVLTLRLGRANIPLFLTNHVYADVAGGPYAGKVQAGGAGMVYAASCVLELTKAQDKDSKTNEIRGAIITVKNAKGRLTKEKIKIKCLIRHKTGLDRYYYLSELAIEAGIFKKVSTKLELPDGTKVFQSVIEKNPEKYFTKEILDGINEWVGKNFTYGGEGEEIEDEISEISDGEGE